MAREIGKIIIAVQDDGQSHIEMKGDIDGLAKAFCGLYHTAAEDKNIGIAMIRGMEYFEYSSTETIYSEKKSMKKGIHADN